MNNPIPSSPLPPELVERVYDAIEREIAIKPFGADAYIDGPSIARAVGAALEASGHAELVEAARAFALGEPTARQQLLDALAKVEGGA
jgi:hypothetical protein